MVRDAFLGTAEDLDPVLLAAREARKRPARLHRVRRTRC
jgi:hypothetical protein